jgi:flavin-dependent dehydrogenase
MRASQPSLRVLQDDDRVAVVGGGPAGSFFSIHLLREAQRLKRRIEVIIIEKRGTTEWGTDACRCRGCNFCAGVISPRLNQILNENELALPDEVIQGSIDYVWIQGQWKNFRLRVPQSLRMCSVFRGSLPSRRSGNLAGFDAFLLGEAHKLGARTLNGKVEAITYAVSGVPRLEIRTVSSGTIALDASFVTIATGINSHCGFDSGSDALYGSLKQLNPALIPGRCRKAFIFEVDVGEDYLAHHLNREVYFIEYGSKDLPLEHAALIPKGNFLTVVLIGKCIDRAVFPRDKQRIASDFLTLPQIERVLPGIAAAPLACACTPKMTVTTARSPFGDRFALIGDALGSRLIKDGLFSAQVTASQLAHVLLHEGTDQQAIKKGYGRTVRWLAADNRFGHMVLGMSRAAFTSPMLSRVLYQAFATECKVRDERCRPLNATLWKIASGVADYREVFWQMCGCGVLRSLLLGAAVTARNVFVELLLGLKWGECRRYPTVVLKEKRQTLKQLVESSLGMELGGSYDFERMYVIKIRASKEEISEELAEFGEPDARFMRLRFLKIKRVQGYGNQVGSRIRYQIPIWGVLTELRLTKRVGCETLLYEFDGRLARSGKLIFNIAPARDGNSRLTLYAAVDFRTGKGILSRALWTSIRVLFPAFVHDVVWDHDLCTIKDQVEWRHDCIASQFKPSERGKRTEAAISCHNHRQTGS